MTLLVVAGILVRDGRLLLARRPAGGAFGGLWELPGGKVEEGERPAAALAREWREELGVRVAGLTPWGFADADGGGRPLTLLFYTVGAVRGEPEPLGCDAVRWAGAEEARLLATPPPDAPALSRLAREGSGSFRDTLLPDAAALLARAEEEDPYLWGSESLEPGRPLFFVKRGLLGRDAIAGLLVATREGPRAYENSCPHAPQPLERPGSHPMTDDGRLLVCSAHEAHFVAETGLCVRGPCEGDSLRPLPLFRDGAGWTLVKP